MKNHIYKSLRLRGDWVPQHEVFNDVAMSVSTLPRTYNDTSSKNGTALI